VADRLTINPLTLRTLLAVSGLTLALLGGSWSGGVSHDDQVLVWVNKRPLTETHLQKVAEQLQLSASKNLDITIDSAIDSSIDSNARQRLLELLIDEELLLQHSESLSSLSDDPVLRKQLVHRVIDQVVQEYLSTSVSEKDLRDFYASHQAVFEHSRHIAVFALRFTTQEDAAAARVSWLAGTDTSTLARQFNSQPIRHIPSSLLPEHMLQRYLGPTLAEVALMLEAGQISLPQIRADGVYLLQVLDEKPAYTPDFELVKQEVRAEYSRRGRDHALEATLAQLRHQAHIRLNVMSSERDLSGSPLFKTAIGESP
jgi:PPIC-type PPIASE domain